MLVDFTKTGYQTRHVLRRGLAPKGYLLFGLNALKDTTKAPDVDLFKPNIPEIPKQRL